MRTDPNRRIYPASCQSAQCGNIRTDAACIACPNRPRLDEFYAWRDRTNAYQPDDIWCPSVWYARNPDPAR